MKLSKAVSNDRKIVYALKIVCILVLNTIKILVMGNIFGSKKSRVTEQDKAILVSNRQNKLGRTDFLILMSVFHLATKTTKGQT